MHIDHLPPEVMSQIFHAHLGHFRDRFQQRYKLNLIPRHVSSRWRSISTDDTTLWTCIFAQNNTPMDQVVQALELSQDALLTLHIEIRTPYSMPLSHRRAESYVGELTTIILPALIRCRRLIIRIADHENTQLFLPKLADLSLPELRFLHLETRPIGTQDSEDSVDSVDEEPALPVIFNGYLPKLRSLVFEVALILGQPAPVFSNILHLDLDDVWEDYRPTFDEMYLFLASLPILECLQLNYFGCNLEDPPIHTPPILDHLTHLMISACDEAAVRFLATLHMPSLTTLFLSFEDVDGFGQFLHHCSPMLRGVRIFVLGAIISSSEDISTAFEHLVDVQEVDLSSTKTAKDFAISMNDVSHFIAFCALSLTWTSMRRRHATSACPA